MKAIRVLLFAAATAAFVSPALADDQSNWWQNNWWQYRYAEAPWHWVCGAFEARHKCNAQFRANRCRCFAQ